MSDKLKFCEECRDDVEYTVTKKELKGQIKGEEYIYLGEEVRCNICNSELYIGKINDNNLDALYGAYREKNNIVSLDIIKAIPDKYSIGKRPLSALLGWGALTFTRYGDGYLPTREYSDKLKRIYEDPYYYLEILETNKNKLESPLSYEKSKKAVDELLAKNDIKKDAKEDRKNDTKKIDMAIQYLLNKCGEVTPLALQKMLYYVQGFYYAFNNNFIFEEDCEAWVHGPVYKEIYNKYSHYGFNPIEKNDDEFNTAVFSTNEKVILDSIVKNIACYSPRMLEFFTHEETPWLITRGDLSEKDTSDKVIEKSIIADYFLKVKLKYDMLIPSDIVSYAQTMFKEVNTK